MTFSNDDLKRLKYSLVDLMSIRLKGSSDAESMSLTLAEWQALLARLEAAEALESYWEYYEPVNAEDEKEYDAKVEAWRKACGHE